MSDYQVLFRKYRPQSFKEIIGQNPVIITLKNAIKQNRLAHAYLFCGSRGTGKTTIARVFAKALNCICLTSDFEPCNECSSCREITSGNSLDVLEIDGASHRGIDDIRQINETVGYASSGKYKIYIIDEVHMLTKEAFNALLKTLEEPPANVKFFFATTESHKVLPTILSRCQRFHLNRIPIEMIIEKLRQITQDLQVSAEEDALRLIATRADGGLRDAESLLDQIISFHEGTINAKTVESILGIMARDILFELDKAGSQGHLSIAFEIAHQIFSQGKDASQFLELLLEHFRNLLLIKLSGKESFFLCLSERDKDRYEASAKLYSQEQCLMIIDLLIEGQNQMRFHASGKIAIESLLLRILRTHYRVPVESMIRRLAELEQKLQLTSPSNQTLTDNKTIKQRENHSIPPSSPPPSQSPVQGFASSITEDPTPTNRDLGKKNSNPVEKVTIKSENLGKENGLSTLQKQSRYDTILQFAAVELEGTIQRKKTL